ncbi:putative alpha beta-hydrolase [Golovinomyces cichoracearum]|uniref:Putative alpha beta-hydrolase n=1 Tax=Golovinomyces cichoracearum TaxID=62708 RepID=A0A420IKC9_9PEZI|nr:putative alpha beta-hydrolase [Golovinomyces cichoracearum]
MKIKKPAIVIIPGAWQGAIGFKNFFHDLNNAGFRSEAVALPSVGSISNILPGLAEDIAAVRSVVSKFLEEYYDVVLLCHSCGGLVGSNASQGLDAKSRSKDGKVGGIIQILFMSAFVVPNGCNFFDLLDGKPAIWMDIQGDKIETKREMMAKIGFNDLSPELAAGFCQQLTHSSASIFFTPSNFEPWSCGIPCAYIFTTQDMAIPHPQQVHMARLLGPDAKTVSLNAGHCSFLSVPDQLIKAITTLSSG